MKRSPFLLLAVALAAGCSRHAPAPVPAAHPAVRVQAAEVRTADQPDYTEATGTIRPVHRAVLAAQVPGAITDLPITLGQRVRAGDILVRLFAADAQARLTQARTQLNAARRDLARESGLLAKGASTAESVRSLEDRVAGAEAQVREAEVLAGYAEVRAPFDGVVARRPANAGDLASPGQPLVELEGTTDLEVEAAIPDSVAATLTPGARFAGEAGGTAFTATLREVSSTSDAATRTIGAKLAVPAGTAVRSGQFARLRIPGALRRAVLVPAAALSPLGQVERVFVVAEGNRAMLRLVKSGARQGDHIEILAGLSGQERVVLDPPADIRDGQPLEVQP